MVTRIASLEWFSLPGDFVAKVDNPFFPLDPGTRYVYEAQTENGAEHSEIVVTKQSKMVMGVSVTVLHDTVNLEGELIEDTLDWYAQDRGGNVWYFGEAVENYENGKLRDRAGSWEAGVNGALPGIIMLADPRLGDTYRQEYYRGKAEDMGQVVELSAPATVPYGSFENVLVTDDWNALEPEVLERKYYAQGVGVGVAEEQVEGGSERGELTTIEQE